MNTQKSFFYHVHGSALGGVIKWPGEYDIDGSRSATSLPITGGRNLAKAEPFKLVHKDNAKQTEVEILTHTGASTEVSGHQASDGSFHSEVTSTVEGLNVNGVLTADKIVAHLKSVHKGDNGEGCIITKGSDFVGLKINGAEVKVDLDHDLFSECDTKEKFCKKHKQDEQFRHKVCKQFLWGEFDPDTPDFIKERYSWVTPPGSMPESRGVIPCTIVKSISTKASGTTVHGNVLVVENFGKIFLGEILMIENMRRLTMMRLELGSPVGGTVIICGGDNNGTPFP